MVFGHASAEALAFPDSTFDVVIFSLSFHKIGFYEMGASIEEAARVTKPRGFIVFLQPGTVGNFYEAEMLYDAGEGNNQMIKEDANEILRSHPALELFKEYAEIASYKFASLNDFIVSMRPKKNLDDLEKFLWKHNFELREKRRVSIFQPR